ncbi:MAG: D-tyrosyl-tRNA(Tyr) deacylase [Bacteroidetes bacterium]|nr:MAG: D-tyrosyl-tRNA(Tyr) deacylase [Bacteroidota bacterium]
MRCLIQRVSESRVIVHHQTVGQIQHGLLVFVGIGKDDTEKDIEWMSKKIIQLRIFNDENGKMNKSLVDVNGNLLIVSQFTLYGDAQRGNRPSFTESAPPEKAKQYYELFIQHCEYLLNKKVQTGIFAADMKVHLINDGPVTIWLESPVSR